SAIHCSVDFMPPALQAGDYDRITQLAREAVAGAR
ncbi:hypothetical protein ACZ87_03150, partial [Candidatus Erwinia dacicola]